MDVIHQGDILLLEKNRMMILVLSKEYFNQTGMAIVCPVTDKAPPDALHIPVEAGEVKGTAQLEHMRSLDLRARFFRRAGTICFEQVQEVSDAAQSVFEYYPFSAL